MNSKAKGKGQRSGERAPLPQMHTHQPHFAQVVSVSANGRSTTAHAHPLDILPRALDYVHKDVFANTAVESWDHGYDLGDPALVAEVQDDEDDGILLKSKRKVYKNSDHPMLTWAGHQDEYLDEMLHLEGRGYPAIYSKCGGCSEADPTYRCVQQTCYRPGLFCKKYIMACHVVLPTHWIQEWNGNFFVRRSLKDLGLVVQLSHLPGFSRDSPLRAHTHFVVINVTRIHYVKVNFCQCDGNIEYHQQLMQVSWWPATARDPWMCATFGVVRLFQIMNCLGKILAHNFLWSLELLTNNDGLNPLPACPHAGRNLPDGWDRINWAAMPEDLRYKYFLFLATDCNFRLINWNVPSATKDPILGDGFSYFVNQEKIFAKRMAENVKEGQIHHDAFEAFDAALRESAPEMVERDVNARDLNKVAKEELLKSGEGDEVEREDTPSTFILMRLEIEESQRYLAINVKAVANPTDIQTVNFLKRCTNLLKHIRVFRKLQCTYMPRLRKYLTASQRTLFNSETDRNAEAVRLFMPLDILDSKKHVSACAVGLLDVEADLQVGEAREVLGGPAAGFAHTDNDKPVPPVPLYGPADANEGTGRPPSDQFENT
ncbi:hypothetical protein MVEN_01013800 [Mycena venus]|uniref:CxC2-like cysteine cluster KDZ transposase-associated domain-containing protein n=1 Tax=Mycena venus TaxID=2733690 RepID=A0A8H7D096_9AGAR|nr:hypothetical protein MVEN_01013800 [Mycena venus]